MSTTVSVIIPYYNGSKWIERALASIAEQTMPATEVIVVNDGSREDERIALGKLADRYTFHIIDKSNGGQGSARNAGVASASADYICFLDQDDFYLPDHIEVLVKAIPTKDHRFGFVYGDAIEADGDGNVLRSSMVKDHNPIHQKRTIIEMLGSDMFVLPSASLIDKKAFLAVDGFDPRFTGYEDDDLFMRLFRKGYTNYFIDRPVYVWCIHEENRKEQGRFYFRDCIMPRFGRAFIADALKAAKRNNEHRPEICNILRKYAEVVYVNKYISRRYKLKLRVVTLFLTTASTRLASLASTIVPRIPVFRRLL